MTTFVVLIRGINVGGKNPVAMQGLRDCLEEMGCTDVATYLNSGNAIVDTGMPAAELSRKLEAELPRRFKLHDEKVLVLPVTEAAFRKVISARPTGFGDEPTKYHSDAIFLIGFPTSKAMPLFSPREGVDAVWPGTGMVYSRRLSAERTKSRLNKIMDSPLYKKMTIRSWQTMTKLLGMLDARGA